MRNLLPISACIATLAAAPNASADASAPFDVAPSLASSGAPERVKHATLELNPLSALIGQYGATIEVLPFTHHALSVTAYFADSFSVDPVTTTMPNNQVQYYQNELRGFGGELGYRYYFGAMGPHGLFFGPSLLSGSYTVDSSREQGHRRAFQKIGGAFDVGYQAIFGSLALGVGAGLQFTAPLQEVPAQGLIIAVQSGAALRPRALASIGYAF